MIVLHPFLCSNIERVFYFWYFLSNPTNVLFSRGIAIIWRQTDETVQLHLVTRSRTTASGKGRIPFIQNYAHRLGQSTHSDPPPLPTRRGLFFFYSTVCLGHGITIYWLSWIPVTSSLISSLFSVLTKRNARKLCSLWMILFSYLFLKLSCTIISRYTSVAGRFSDFDVLFEYFRRISTNECGV